MKFRDQIIREIFNQVVVNKTFRGIAARKLDRMIYNSQVNGNGVRALPFEKLQKYAFNSAVLKTVCRNLDLGYIKPHVTRKMMEVFTQGGLKTDRTKALNPVKEAYRERYGDYPPLFCVLSPTKACNLQCEGCYATSDRQARPKLDFAISRRIVEEVHDIFGSRFMTISGGEPFMYRCADKTIFDLFEEFNDMFFLVYTNGTLIDKKIVRRLASTGNATPCISVEGFEAQTDDRRGKGVHRRILEAVELLKEEGVPFGISITATSKNIDVLLQEEFYDYFFREVGVTFLFQFQMMPIGRGKEVITLMITPEQRVALYQLWKRLLFIKKYPIADFWNSGALVDGCLAYGRWNGYFYVNWDGNIMPCVFVPFYKDNVKQLFEEGKTLADAMQSRLFKNGREWQKEVGFGNPDKRKNTLMPCSFKDHFENFHRNILTADAHGENPDAEAMRNDPDFAAILKKYDEDLERLTSKIFETEYLEKKRETVTV